MWGMGWMGLQGIGSGLGGSVGWALSCVEAEKKTQLVGPTSLILVLQQQVRMNPDLCTLRISPPGSRACPETRRFRTPLTEGRRSRTWVAPESDSGQVSKVLGFTG